MVVPIKGELKMFEENVEILTNQGFIPVKKIEKGVVCYLKDAKSGKCTMSKVQKIQKIKYKGNIFNFRKLKIYPLCQTVFRHNKIKNPTKNGLHSFLSINQINLKVGKIAINNTIEQIKGKVVKTILGYNVHDFLRVLGFFITKGSIEGQTILFTKQNEYILIKYMDILSKMTGEDTQIIDLGDRMIFRIHNKKLAMILKEFKSLSLDKELPEFIWDFHYSHLASLYEGLCDGSRNIRHCGKFYYYSNIQHGSSSIKFVSDIQRLAIHLGLHSSVTPLSSNKKIIKFININGKIKYIYSRKPVYIVGIKQGEYSVIKEGNYINNLKLSRFNGYLHAFLFNSPNKLMCVRQNGSIIWLTSSYKT
jgi:hypothetical protein